VLLKNSLARTKAKLAPFDSAQDKYVFSTYIFEIQSVSDLEFRILDFRPQAGELASFGFVFTSPSNIQFSRNPLSFRYLRHFTPLQIGFVFSI